MMLFVTRACTLHIAWIVRPKWCPWWIKGSLEHLSNKCHIVLEAVRWNLYLRFLSPAKLEATRKPMITVHTSIIFVWHCDHSARRKSTDDSSSSRSKSACLLIFHHLSMNTNYSAWLQPTTPWLGEKKNNDSQSRLWYYESCQLMLINHVMW